MRGLVVNADKSASSSKSEPILPLIPYIAQRLSPAQITLLDENPLGGRNKEKYALFLSLLGDEEKKVSVVMQADKYTPRKDGKTHFIFSGVFANARQAEGMLEYLRTRQRANCYLKEVTLAAKDGVVKLQGNVSEQETLTPIQLVVSILHGDIKGFFSG